MRVLVVEDDAPLASFVRKGLEAEHYAVDVAPDGEQARRMALESDYDLLVLDLNLPKLDGIGVLGSIRPKKPSLPVLVLTARSRIEDRVQSLDSGADDCLIKPFSFTELSARVRALLRRGPRTVETVLRVADLQLDRVERKVERAGKHIELTSKEFALLEYLMRNAGHRVTRTMIVEHVWNLSFDTTTNIVDVYINYLRDKFEVTLGAVEQLAYRDFLARISDASYCASFNLLPGDASGILQMDLSLAFPIVDLLLGGTGGVPQGVREVSEIEAMLIEGVGQVICHELDLIWRPLGLQVTFEQRQSAEQIMRLMTAQEKTLTLTFEVTMTDSKGMLSIAFPAVVSSALLRKLATELVSQRPRGPAAHQESILKRLLESTVEMELGTPLVAVKLTDLLAMQTGCVLPLRLAIEEPARLRLKERDYWLARPVRSHARCRAAQLLERVVQPEEGAL